MPVQYRNIRGNRTQQTKVVARSEYEEYTRVGDTKYKQVSRTVTAPPTNEEDIQIVTGTLSDVYEQQDHERYLQMGFLVEKRVYITTPKYVKFRRDFEKGRERISMDPWKNSYHDVSGWKGDSVPGWVISLFVHGVSNEDAKGDVSIWLSDDMDMTHPNLSWLQSLGTVREEQYDGEWYTQLTLSAKGHDLFNLLKATRDDDRVRPTIPWL